jgi:hypothetical protein
MQIVHKLKSSYIYIYLFLILYSTAGIFSQKYPLIINIIFIILTIPTIPSLLKRKFIVFIGISLSLFFLINYLNYPETVTNLFGFIVRFILVLSFVIYCYDKNIPIFKILSKTVFFIACYSLITYVIFDTFSIIEPSRVEVVNTKPYHVYLGFHYHWQHANWYGTLIARNNSIFWEPGVYQIFLNFALLYNLFFNQNKNLFTFTNIVLLLSIATTLSTTGIAVACVILFFKFMGKSKSYFGTIIKFMMFPAIFSIVVYFLKYVIKQKFEYGVTSVNLRTDDLLYGFYTFLEKPILGWGFWNFSGYEQFTGTIKNSNGLIFLLFQLGVVGFSFYFFFIFVISKRILKQYSLRGAILFVIYIFASMANEPISYNNYIILFLCLGIYLFLNNKKTVI